MEYRTRQEMYEAHKARRRRMAEAAARFAAKQAEAAKAKLNPPVALKIDKVAEAKKLADEKIKEFFDQAPKKVLSITDQYRLVVDIDPSSTIALYDIVHDVCRRHKLTKTQVFSRCRKREINRARWEIWYLARENMSLSLPTIGKRTGGFDHTTVLHGVRKFKELLKKGEVTLTLPKHQSKIPVDDEVI